MPFYLLWPYGISSFSLLDKIRQTMLGYANPNRVELGLLYRVRLQA